MNLEEVDNYEMLLTKRVTESLYLSLSWEDII